MRLLITRPEPDASALARELGQIGHQPLLQPLLEFKRLAFNPKPLRLADGLIVTSGNGLRALQEAFILPDIIGIPVFCAGGETAKRVRAAGFKALSGTADTAEALVPEIVSSMKKGARLVHVTGEHQAFDLREALTAVGFDAHILPAYTMEARAAFDAWLVDAFEASDVDGVILMSPRTGEIFVRLCQSHGVLSKAKTLFYFCLAGSAAAKLAPIDPKFVFVSAKPNRKALLALLAESFEPETHVTVAH